MCELDGGEVEGGVEAAGVEEEGVDVGVGELVDEDGEAEVTAVVDEVLEERGLAAAEESGDEGAAHAAAGEAAAAVEHAVLKRRRHLVALHFCFLLACSVDLSLCFFKVIDFFFLSYSVFGYFCLTSSVSFLLVRFDTHKSY